MKKRFLGLLLGILILGGNWQNQVYGEVGTNASHVYDMKQFWPFPNKILEYQHYDEHGQPEPNNVEKIWHERWSDGNHFSIHHWWDTWCPRVDDVMVWVGDKLYYTDTYNFYEGHHTNLSPGHVWTNRWMEDSAPAQFSDVTHRVYTITHSDCEVTSSHFWFSTNDRVWRRLLEGLTDWSPFAGGSSSSVPVVRLDETTYINNDLDDWFKEEWYFYHHPALGWIAIHSNGYRQPKNSSLPQFLWDMRLIAVDDPEMSKPTFLRLFRNRPGER